ncbi:NAC domain-containing protein 53-like [Solanum stenotomum]|uniref:NAC domain-containing protein 53-like n=1 Tax=Solanum stenotomum TaxID=172797 RepID=UPI0020D130C1|nr:NAC domain-containing protein 53-like [Solanum stenotomum]
MALSRSKHSLGFRFHPSDKELINHLKRFMLDGIFPRPNVIKIKDVFGDLEPWQIIDGEKTCYFLTRLKKFKNSNKKFSRTVGSGTWSGQTSGIPIRDKSNRNIIIGYKRSLRYKSGIEKYQSEKWLLKEYFLPDEYIKKSKNKDIFAICRIKEKKNEEEENNNDDDDDDVKDEDVDGLVDYLFGGNYDQVISNDNDNQLEGNYEASTSTLNNYGELREVEQFNGINPYDNSSIESVLEMIEF